MQRAASGQIGGGGGVNKHDNIKVCQDHAPELSGRLQCWPASTAQLARQLWFCRQMVGWTIYSPAAMSPAVQVVIRVRPMFDVEQEAGETYAVQIAPDDPHRLQACAYTPA